MNFERILLPFSYIIVFLQGLYILINVHLCKIRSSRKNSSPYIQNDYGVHTYKKCKKNSSLKRKIMDEGRRKKIFALYWILLKRR